jgi:adenosine kinase
MSILVTGSIAVDQIMVFQDHFKNHILPDKIHTLNVSFFVPSLEKRFGGTGANIAYNLCALDVDPILLATAGSDFGDYADWMDRFGLRRDWIRVLEDAYTSQCFITTDLDNNQLNSFHPGAMERAHEASLADVGEDFVAGIVSPNGKRAMVEYASELKSKGIPCVVDPGQGLPMFSGPELIELLEGAAVYVVNDYEWALTLEKTGLDEGEIADRVGAVVVTRGEKGSSVRRGALDAGTEVAEDSSQISSVAPSQVVDPTGCGDAYRSGILYAILHQLPLETGARLGSLMGSVKVETPGPQSIETSFSDLRERFEREFGYAL